jgi:hypothetical protein
VGSGCVLKSMTRLLSGANMEPASILREHTLVMAGEIVDSGSVWQGWPSQSQLDLETHRRQLTAQLSKRTSSNSSNSSSSSSGESSGGRGSGSDEKRRLGRSSSMSRQASFTAEEAEAATAEETALLLSADKAKKRYDSNARGK